MPTRLPHPAESRASNGIFFKVVGEGEPLLLLHGVMATGEMFDPLVPLLKSGFRMLIPDLRGHGKSGELPGPYDVPALAADLDAVIAEAGFERCAVLGYSHGGAVAQQLAHAKPESLRRMMLACTYLCVQRCNAQGAYGGGRVPIAPYGFQFQSTDGRQSCCATVEA